MERLPFYKIISLSTLTSILLYVILGFAIPIFPYLDFFIISILFFLVYNLVLFFASKRAKSSKVKNQFIHLVLYNVFVKIILSFLIVFVYFKITEPDNKFFIVPFLICYLVYTVFETYFMSKEARY